MSESRQRWRLVFARDEEARYLSHLDAMHLWERALRRGRIPLAVSEGFSPRPRLVFGAPLPLGMLAEHELADLFVCERLARREMRLRLNEGMPRGYRLLDLWDEWVGAPALATLIDAADYRMTLLGSAAGQLRDPAAALLRADTLPRERRREKKRTSYDLRPLLLALEVRETEAGRKNGDGQASAGVWMRLRHSQDRGSGRPEEVVAALAEQIGLAVLSFERPETEAPGGQADKEPGPIAGAPEPASEPAPGGLLEIVQPVRERLWLAGEAAVDAIGPAT
jgi:radical SAM-linked protein